jgi:hypothetical protein
MSQELNEKFIEALARAAGLERAWVLYREEVVAAAREAARRRQALPDLDPAAEPWPPMSVPPVSSGGDE